MPQITIDEADWNKLLEEKKNYQLKVEEMSAELNKMTEQLGTQEKSLKEYETKYSELERSAMLYKDIAYDKMYNKNRPTEKVEIEPKPNLDDPNEALKLLNETSIDGI